MKKSHFDDEIWASSHCDVNCKNYVVAAFGALIQIYICISFYLFYLMIFTIEILKHTSFVCALYEVMERRTFGIFVVFKAKHTKKNLKCIYETNLWQF